MSGLPLTGQAELRRRYAIPDGVTYLNNGSFGPPPAAVSEAQNDFRRRLDANPMAFLVRELEDLLGDAAAILARFVGTTSDNLVFVPNATTAMNVVAASLPLSSGDEVLLNDHEYGAVRRIWEYRADAVGAKVVTAELPYPLSSTDEIARAIFARATPQTRLIVVSHVTSPTAVSFPIAEIARRARELGIPVAVDGPHAVAMLDLELDELDVDYYCASCHKWLSAPIGSGFLYVHPRRQASTVPPIRSWGRTPAGMKPSWRDEFRWVGTDDPSKYLAVSAAIRFLGEFGFEQFRAHGHELARQARRQIEAITGLEAFVPDSPAWYGTMITLPLPPGDAPRLMEAMWRKYRIEIPVIDWNGRRYIRPSFHLYNSEGDLKILTDALRAELDAEPQHR
jgi:isopenicillin-N epimerase